MSSMDQNDITRITKLEHEAQSDPKKAAQLRRQLKKRLDRLKSQRPKR